MYDLIIIGAGPMGLFASFYAGMHKIKALALETHSIAGGQLSRLYKEKYIYDIPGFRKIKAGDYVENLLDQYRQYENDVEIKYNTIIKSFNKKEDHFEVVTSKGKFLTKLLLITSGNGTYVPRQLDLEKAEDCTNILYHIDGLDMFQDKKVVLLGGGDSAVDWALELQKYTSSCTLIHRRNEFRAHQSSVDQLFESNIKVLTPYVTTDLIKSDGKVTALEIENVETKEKQLVECDYILVNFGLIISNSVATQLGLNNHNGNIIVKGNMESSVSGVFAAGNCVTYDGKIKTITCGMGEVSVAINSINYRLHPSKAPQIPYSSLMFSSKESNEK
jgi:thioredoxin reductase (NADPH)